MAEGMDVDPAPVVRDKKRFEVKKVPSYMACFVVVLLFLSFFSVECCCTVGVG